jgi:hypothetical protein
VISGTVADLPSVGPRVVNAWNAWGKSNDELVTVMVCPDKPADLAGVSPDAYRVQLSWTAVPGADSYAVHRASTRNGTYDLAGAPETNTFDDHDSLLAPGAAFYYFVRALNDSTYPSLPADDTIAVTVAFAPDSALPHAVVDAPAMTRDSAVADTNTLAMSGTVDTDDGVHSVSMRLDGAPVAVALSGGQWSANPSGLLPCQWNTLVITARDNSQRVGVDTFWIYGRFGVPQPTAPQVALRLCTALSLRWNAVKNCSSYVLSRRRHGETAFAPVAVGLGDTSFIDSGLNTGALYEYVVQAHCEVHDGSFELRDTSAWSLVRLDSTALCFSRQYADHSLFAIARSPDGGYAATGSEGVILRISPTHATEWVFRTMPDGGRHTGFWGLASAPDGGVVAVGTLVSGPQHLVCLSPSGSVAWDAAVPGITFARSMVAAPDGGFVLCGVTDIVKTDCRGNTVQ